MSKRRLSITQQIMVEARRRLDLHQNDVTRRAYIYNTKKFVKYCRENFNCRTYDDCKSHVQDYANFLIGENYSADTIHSYIAAVCAAFDGVKLKDIKKPRRITAHNTRNRKPLPNPRACQNLQNPSYNSVIFFQSQVGIRRNELKNLRGCDWTEIDGNFYVIVRNGKGGKKNQLQWVNPEYKDAIKQYFLNIEPNNYVFSDNEVKNNKLPFHKLRAECARECYFYLLKKVQDDPSIAIRLESELRERWKQNKDRHGNVRSFRKEQITGIYTLRGENRKKAQRLGYPLHYSKLILAWVSCFKLSHFRNGIAVTNYILP